MHVFSVFLCVNRETYSQGFQLCQWSFPFKNRWPPYLKVFYNDFLMLIGDLNGQRPRAREPKGETNRQVLIGLKASQWQKQKVGSAETEKKIEDKEREGEFVYSKRLKVFK